MFRHIYNTSAVYKHTVKYLNINCIYRINNGIIVNTNNGAKNEK